jgi:hypothetical protein
MMSKPKTKRDDVEPPEMVAKKVRSRLIALDREMKNLDAFCVLLKDLNAHDLSAVKGPHVAAITMVRAGILRGAIAAVMACLERLGGDRASVGEILGLLPDAAAFQRVRESHEGVRKSPLFDRVKRLRDDIAHNLVREDAQTPVHYEDVYKLADIAEKIVVQLFKACGRGTPEFLDYRMRTAEHAKIFWDTYFLGMGSTD